MNSKWHQGIVFHICYAVHSEILTYLVLFVLVAHKAVTNEEKCCLSEAQHWTWLQVQPNSLISFSTDLTQWDEHAHKYTLFFNPWANQACYACNWFTSSLAYITHCYRVANCLNPPIFNLFSPCTAWPALISNELNVAGYSAVKKNHPWTPVFNSLYAKTHYFNLT